MVLADAIWTDPMTQKRTILGTFSVVFAQKFPAPHSFAVYCALTDGRGPTEVELRLVDANELREPIAGGKGQIDFSDPRMVVEMESVFVGVVLPEPGEYRFQLLGAGELLMERRLIAIHAAAPDQEVADEDSGEADGS